MNRSVIGWILAALLALGGAAFAYVFWFAGGSGEPTTNLTTPELSATTTTPTAQSTSTSTGEAPTSSPPSQASAKSFVIDPAGSTARFEIDEVLNGSPQRVIGVTDEVVGQVRVDVSDLTQIELSEIIVNARTLTTGSERRDRAIRGPVILNSGSDEHELITLEVTSVDDLGGSAEVGDTVEFTIIGDLTIKGVTQPVTFDATVTRSGEDTIEGSATAQVTRDMFDIGIPSVPQVADVTNEVIIGLDFVATAG